MSKVIDEFVYDILFKVTERTFAYQLIILIYTHK